MALRVLDAPFPKSGLHSFFGHCWVAVLADMTIVASMAQTANIMRTPELITRATRDRRQNTPMIGILMTIRIQMILIGFICLLTQRYAAPADLPLQQIRTVSAMVRPFIPEISVYESVLPTLPESDNDMKQEHLCPWRDRALVPTGLCALWKDCSNQRASHD